MFSELLTELFSAFSERGKLAADGKGKDTRARVLGVLGEIRRGGRRR
jgi:hypothetical protein